MTSGSYKQFCPVAMAAEVLCTRWTLVVMRELVVGTTRFNDLRLGVWGQRWIDSEVSLQNLDVNLLMWDMRRNIDVQPMPRRRSVIQFRYGELPASQRTWWLLVDPDSGVDLCSVDPGFDVDLYVS